MTLTEQPQQTAATRTRTGPNAWLVIGGVVTMLLIALGALSVAGWLGYRTETQHQVYDQAVSDLEIDLDTGDVTLSAGEADTVVVTRRYYWSWTRPSARESWTGSTLRVDVDCPRSGWTPGPGCGVDYTIEVPAGVTVRARTGTGDIVVHNIGGELHLKSGTGDIAASGVASETVEISTGTGDVMIELLEPPASVTAETGTGDIHIEAPGSVPYRVRAQTGTGDITIAVRQDAAAAASISASTGTGDVAILAR